MEWINDILLDLTFKMSLKEVSRWVSVIKT